MPSAFDDFVKQYEAYYEDRTDNQDGNQKARPSMAPSIAVQNRQVGKDGVPEMLRRRSSLSAVQQARADAATRRDPEVRHAAENPLALDVADPNDPFAYVKGLAARSDPVHARSLYAFLETPEAREWAAAVQTHAAESEKDRRAMVEAGQGREYNESWIDQWVPDDLGERLGGAIGAIGNAGDAVLHAGNIGGTGTSTPPTPGSQSMTALPGVRSMNELAQAGVLGDQPVSDALNQGAALLGTTQRAAVLGLYYATPDINDQAKMAGGPSVRSLEGFKWLWEQSTQASIAQAATGFATSPWRLTGPSDTTAFDPNVVAPTTHDRYSIFDPLQKEELKQNAWYSFGTGATDLSIQVSLAVFGDKGWSAAAKGLGLKGGLMDLRDMGAAEEALQAHLKHMATDGAEGQRTWFGTEVERTAAMNDRLEIMNTPLVYNSVNAGDVADILIDTNDPVITARVLMANRNDRASLLMLTGLSPSRVYQLTDVDRAWVQESLNNGRIALSEAEQEMMHGVFQDMLTRNPQLEALDTLWHKRVLENMGSVVDHAPDRAGEDFVADTLSGNRLIPKRGYKVDTSDPLAIKGVFNETQPLPEGRVRGAIERANRQTGRTMGVGFHEQMAGASLDRDVHQFRVQGDSRANGRPFSRYISHLTDRNAMNMVTFSSLRPGDAVTEMATWVSKSKAFKGAKKVQVRIATEVDGRTVWHDTLLSGAEFTARWTARLAEATNDSDRARVIRETEKEVMSAEVYRHAGNLTIDDLGAFIDSITEARDGHAAQIAKRGYAFSPAAGGRLVYEPMFARQLADSVPLTDLAGLQRALDKTVRQGKRLPTEGIRTTGMRIQNGAEIGYAIWRTGVLFNPKYTLKNAVFEPLLSSIMSAGSDYVWDSVTHFKNASGRASAGAVEPFVNAALWATHPLRPSVVRARAGLRTQGKVEKRLAERMKDPQVASFLEQSTVINALYTRQAEASAARDMALATFHERRAAAQVPDAQGLLHYQGSHEFFYQEAKESGKPVVVPQDFHRGVGSGDGWVYLPDKTKRWGIYGAGGTLVRHVDEDGVERFLLAQRSDWLDGGAGQWTVPGGALDYHEKPLDGALRELEEELGFKPDSHTVVGDVQKGHAESQGAWKYTTTVIDVPEMVHPRDMAWGADGETQAVAWHTREEMEALDLMPQFRDTLPDAYKVMETKPGAQSDILDDLSWADEETKGLLDTAAWNATEVARVDRYLSNIVAGRAKDDPRYASARARAEAQVKAMVDEHEAVLEISNQLDSMLPGWRAWKPKGLNDFQRVTRVLTELLDSVDGNVEGPGALRQQGQALDARAAGRARKEWDTATARTQRVLDKVQLDLDHERGLFWNNLDQHAAEAGVAETEARQRHQAASSRYYAADDEYQKALRKPVYDEADYPDGSTPMASGTFQGLDGSTHTFTGPSGTNYALSDGDITHLGMTHQEWSDTIDATSDIVQGFMPNAEAWMSGFGWAPDTIQGAMGDYYNGNFIDGFDALKNNAVFRGAFTHYWHNEGRDFALNQFPTDTVEKMDKVVQRLLNGESAHPPSSAFGAEVGKVVDPASQPTIRQDIDPSEFHGFIWGPHGDPWASGATNRANGYVVGWRAKDWHEMEGIFTDHANNWLEWLRDKVATGNYPAAESILAKLDQNIPEHGWRHTRLNQVDHSTLRMDNLDFANYYDHAPGGPGWSTKSTKQFMADHGKTMADFDHISGVRKIVSRWVNGEEHLTPLAGDGDAVPIPITAQDAISKQKLAALKIERDRADTDLGMAMNELRDAEEKRRLSSEVKNRAIWEETDAWGPWADITFGLSPVASADGKVLPLYHRDRSPDTFAQMEGQPTGHDPLPVGTSLFRASHASTQRQPGGPPLTGEVHNRTVGNHWTVSPDTTSGFGNTIAEAAYESPDQIVDPYHPTMMEGSRANPLSGEMEVRFKHDAPVRIVRTWTKVSDNAMDFRSAVDLYHQGSKPPGWIVTELGNGIPTRENGGRIGSGPRHQNSTNPKTPRTFGGPHATGILSDLVTNHYGPADQATMLAWDAEVEHHVGENGLTYEYLPDSGQGNLFGADKVLGIQKMPGSGDSWTPVILRTSDNKVVEMDPYSTYDRAGAIAALAKFTPTRNPDLNKSLVFDPRESDFDYLDPSKQAPTPPQPAWEGGPMLFHGRNQPLRGRMKQVDQEQFSNSMWAGRGVNAADDVDTATYGYGKSTPHVYGLRWRNRTEPPKVLNLSTEVIGQSSVAGTVMGDVFTDDLANLIVSAEKFEREGGTPPSWTDLPPAGEADVLREFMGHMQSARYGWNSPATLEEAVNAITRIGLDNEGGVLSRPLSPYSIQMLHRSMQRRLRDQGYDATETVGGSHWGDRAYRAFVVLNPADWDYHNVGGSVRVNGRRWASDEEVERADTAHGLADYLEGDNPTVNARITANAVPTGGGFKAPDWMSPGHNAVGNVRAGALRSILSADTPRDGTGVVVVRWNPNTRRATVAKNGHLLEGTTDNDYVQTVVDNWGRAEHVTTTPVNSGITDATWGNLDPAMAAIPGDGGVRTPQPELDADGKPVLDDAGKPKMLPPGPAQIGATEYPTGYLHPAVAFPRADIAMSRAAKKPSTLAPKIRQAHAATTALQDSLNDILTGTKAEYAGAMDTFESIQRRLGTSKRRSAELRQNVKRERWQAPWRPNKDGFDSTKVKSQDGTERHVRFPELFQGSLGSAYRDEFTAANTVVQNYDPSRVQRTAQAKAKDTFSSDGMHQPGDSAYWNEMSHWIDRTLKGDPLAMRIAGGASDREILGWLQSTNAGKRYASTMKWDQEPDWSENTAGDYVNIKQGEDQGVIPGMDPLIGENGRQMVSEARRVVEAYLPTPELRRWAVRTNDEVQDADAVEAAFAKEKVTIGQLSPIHANEFQSTVDLSGTSATLKVVDQLWKKIATDPENAVGRFPWSAYQYRREMRSRLQQYADQGLDLTPSEINAIRHDAARSTLHEMERTFYTIRRQNSALFAARWVTAFPQAQANAIYRFSRLAARRPGTAAVIANAWIGAYKNWGIDKDGNPVGDDWSKMDRMVFDVPPALAKGLGVALPGTVNEGKVTISRQGIDFLSTPPSSSFFVTVPMATILANAPSVDAFIRQVPGGEAFYKFVFPFADDFGGQNKETGVPTSSRSTLNVAGITVDFTGAVPSTVRRAASIINPSDDEAQKAVIASWQYLQSKWLQEGSQGQEPTLSDAQQMARGVLIQNFIASSSIPGLRTTLPGQQYRDAWTKIKDKEPDFQKALATALDQYGPWMLWYTTSMRSTNFGLGASYSTDAYGRIRDNSTLAQNLGSLDKDGKMVGLLVQDADTTFNASVYNYYQDHSVPGATTLIREPYDPGEFSRRVKAQTGWQIYSESEENMTRILHERGLTSLNQSEAKDLREAWTAYKDDLGEEYPEWDAERNSINTGRASQTVRGLEMMVADKNWMKQQGNSPYMGAITRYLSERQGALEQRMTTESTKTEFDAAWDAYVIDEILPLSPDFRDVYSRNLQGSDLK